MCGIAGIIGSDQRTPFAQAIRQMTEIMAHRGPDDEGYLLGNIEEHAYAERSGRGTIPELRGALQDLDLPSANLCNIALGHRRLSILDLTAAGHQPMYNEDRTLWIVHNGEIHNYGALRSELESKGHHFKSRSDTEIILHSYEEWGADCPNRFNGMWAFAIWDSRAQELFCSRDRFGIKPFYYFFNGEILAFASEIKALLETGLFPRRPDNETVFNYLAHYLQDCTDHTFFEGVRQLRGGCSLIFNAREKSLQINQYYDLRTSKAAGTGREGNYAGEFLELFEDSVRIRLLSDVALGSCLSGGLDSSSIVCMIDSLMRRLGLKLPQNSDIQKTFSARFREPDYTENKYIDEVIKQTGVDAYAVYPGASAVWQDLEHFIWHQEEPCTHNYVPSQWLVYKLAAETGVKVVLDGQGADEMLVGYDLYYPALFSMLLRAPEWKNLAREAGYRYKQSGNIVFRDLLEGMYKQLPGNFRKAARRHLRREGAAYLQPDFASSQSGYFYNRRDEKGDGLNLFDQFLYEVLVNTNLPGLLRDLDKNSMAHSVEARPPFLDHRLVEFAFALPWERKIQHGCRKFILRQAMKGILPDTVVNRADKMGFSTPFDGWTRNELAGEFRDVFSSSSFRQRGYLDTGKVLNEFQAHCNGQKNIKSLFWCWLNLEIWFKVFIDK